MAGANHSSEVARMREPSGADMRSAMLGASNDELKWGCGGGSGGGIYRYRWS